MNLNSTRMYTNARLVSLVKQYCKILDKIICIDSKKFRIFKVDACFQDFLRYYGRRPCYIIDFIQSSLSSFQYQHANNKILYSVLYDNNKNYEIGL